MKILKIEDVRKRITIELSYDEWFEIIYLKEREKRENNNSMVAPVDYGKELK